VSGGANAVMGGLVGVGYGIIDLSSATGSVTGGTGSYAAGGLVGWLDSSSSTTRSFATGSVTSDSIVGGFAGLLNINAGSGYLYDNYATGTASGPEAAAGGFIGFNGSASFDLNFNNAYSIGAVAGGSGVTGGFVGYDDDPGLMTDAYWDLDTSGQSQG